MQLFNMNLVSWSCSGIHTCFRYKPRIY